MKRKEEVRTSHGVDKEKTGRNDDCTECDVANISKRKPDADVRVNENER